jgi:hypothetical protein
MANHREYYKGEGGGFPQVQAMVSIMNLCMPMSHLCTKVAPTMQKQLIVWFVQVCVNN